MKIRKDIADMLQAGIPQSRIARELHCAQLTVQRTREALGLPAPGAGQRPTRAVEDAFHAHAQPGENGHVMWDGPFNSYGTPVLYLRGTRYAYRIAFTLHHRREPIGRVFPSCGLQGCVAGSHLEDQPMREHLNTTFSAIFGGTA